MSKISASERCPKCICGLKLNNTAKESEYYSQYYSKPTNWEPIKHFLTSCKCWHGNFIKDFYKFPRINIYLCYQTEEKQILVKFSEFGKFYSISDILELWIIHKTLDKFLEAVL